MSASRISLLSSVCASAICVFGLLAPLVAKAQTAAAPSTPVAVSGEAPSDLEEIVVTARKVKENLITTPVAITALTASQLEEKGIIDVMGIANFTPGFTDQNQQVNRNDRSFVSYIIRGVAEAGGTAGQIRPAVTTFLDGSPMGAGEIPEIYDIQQIEVVKGPQSAYFGRASFAGAVSFSTKTPSFDWKEILDAQGGTYGTSDVWGSVEGAVIPDILSFRLAGRSYHTDGDYSNYGQPSVAIGERDTKSGSLTFYATPIDGLTAKVYASALHDDDGPPANSQYINTSYNCNAGKAPTNVFNYICGQLPQPNPSSTRYYNTTLSPYVYYALEGHTGGQRVLGDDFIDHFGLEKVDVHLHEEADYTFENDYVLSVNGGYDSDKWAFITDTTFRNGMSIPNANYGVIPNVLPYFSRSALGDQLNIDKSAEIRFTSPRSDRFKWMVGGSYFSLLNENLTNVWGVTGLIASSPPTVNNSTTYGLFGSAEYEIWDGLSLSFEGRYQLDEISQLVTLSGVRKSLSGDFHSFTPRIILKYELTPNESVYVSYAEGNRPGEFNANYYVEPAAIQKQILAQSAVTPSVPEENIRMIEFGAKGSFLNNTLRLLADVYYGRWTGRHIANGVNVYSSGVLIPLTFTVAGGVTDLAGFEAEGTYLVTPELSVNGTFDVADTDIKQTYCSDCLLTTGNAYPTGTMMPGYPKYTATISGTYQMPTPVAMFPDLESYVHVDWVWRSRIYDSEANVAWTPNQSVFNARIGVTDGPYTFEIYGKNIFDDKTPTSLARNTDPYTTGNTISISLPDRAAFGVHAIAKF